MNNNRLLMSEFRLLMSDFSPFKHGFSEFFRERFPQVYELYMRRDVCGNPCECITLHDASVILKEWQKGHEWAFYRVRRVSPAGSMSLL